MPLFGKREESEKRFKEAERYSNPKKKEFDLDMAIHLLEEALMLKPDNEQYRQKLDEFREIKTKHSLKFSMRVQVTTAGTSPDGELGVVVGGIVEQGSIRDGDEVQIKGGEDTRMVKVFKVVSPKGVGFGVTGQYLNLAIKGVSNIEDGDIIEGV